MFSMDSTNEVCAAQPYSGSYFHCLHKQSLACLFDRFKSCQKGAVATLRRTGRSNEIFGGFTTPCPLGS